MSIDISQKLNEIERRAENLFKQESPSGHDMEQEYRWILSCINVIRSRVRWFVKNNESLFGTKYNPGGDAREIITALIKGIESWASDEDGIHPDCREAYKKAKFIIGE